MSHNDIMMMSDHDEETSGRDVAKTHRKGAATETWPSSRAPSRLASSSDVADVTKQKALSFSKTSGRWGAADWAFHPPAAMLERAWGG